MNAPPAGIFITNPKAMSLIFLRERNSKIYPTIGYALFAEPKKKILLNIKERDEKWKNH